MGTKFRIFEAFAGIGAQRKALSNIGASYTISGMAEWYVPAIVSYQAIHNRVSLNKINHKISREDMVSFLTSKPLSMNSKTLVSNSYWVKKDLNSLRIVYTAIKKSYEEGNIFDVNLLYKRKLEDVDLLTYSFPCQDLSQQGKQRGMSKGLGTRSGLLWQIEKALDATPKNKLPKYLLMENVTALINKNNKYDLDRWKEKLKSLGYKNDIGVLNAGDFGSSQARRRVFMISSLGEKISLPSGTRKPRSINRILDKEPISKDFLPALDKYDVDEYGYRKTKSNINKAKLKDYSTFNSEAFVYDPKFTGPTLTATGANSRIKFYWNEKIRRINAREAYKYMGFTERDFNRVSNLNYLNESKMIFTCGNSISVEVLEKIFRKVIENEKSIISN